MLWSDIAADSEKLLIPVNHKEILRQRLDRIASGDAKFRNWEEIRKNTPRHEPEAKNHSNSS